jgi:hypothetical protein
VKVLHVIPSDRSGGPGQAITRLLADGAEWERWSQQARRRYEENFTAKHFQRRLLAALFGDEVERQMKTERVTVSNV